jgi:spermidine synthase
MMNRRSEYYGFEPGTYVRLIHKPTQTIIMTNTWMEWYTNTEFIRKAQGDILIGGLGIGMILLAIQDKPEVKTITVVEKEAEIIDLVTPQLPLNEKVTIVHEDIFTYKPTQKYDTIYFDIWNDVCGDNYEEMKKLNRKYSRSRNPDSWIGSWRSYECKRLHREDKRYV